MIQRFPIRRATAAGVRARRAPMLERLEQRHLMAGWSPVGPETLVNDTTAGIQETTFESRKAIAGDDTGRYVVAWSGAGTGDADGIYARRYDASGTLGVSFRVNTTTAGVQTEAAVAMDNAGNFVVIWSSNLQDGAGWGVYGQRYNAAGVAQGAEFRVNVTTAGNQNQPSVAADADGDFVVTWTSENVDGSGLGIAARRYNAAGAPQGGQFVVNGYIDGNQILSAVAMDDTGTFTVVWQSDYTLTGSIGIFAQRFNATGGTVGSWSVVNTTTNGSQLAPSIAMNASGAYVVAWTSDTDDGNPNNSQDGSGRGIFAQRYTNAGAKTGAEFGVNATTTGDQQYPSVAVDNTGAFVIAWESAAQDASGWGAYAREYTSAGVSVGAEFRLNTTTTGDQQNVFVAGAGNGDYVSAWSGNGAGDAAGVFLQRYEDLAPGVTVTPTSGLVTTEAGATDSFTVVLASRPTANVTISINSNDTTEGTVSTALLTFTRNNWNVAQTVTLTGVNDALNDGNVGYTIQTGAATSTDADYGGRAVSDVSATNVDTTPPPNSPPAVGTTGTTLQYVENAGASAVDAGLTVTDANDATLTGAVVSVIGYVSGQDVLEFTTAGGITGVWNAGAGTLTLSGVATVAQYQAALRTVTYRNDSDNPSVAARSVRFVVNDGQANSSPSSRSVAVNAVNDPPVSTDDTYAAEQGVVLSVPVGTGVLANDTDVDGGTLSATLLQQASNGTVQLFANGSFTYTPAPGFWGTDQFVYSAGDGAGGTDAATVTLQVVRAAGVTVSPTSGLVTTETGGSASFTVVLDRAPTADVRISLASSDTTEGTISDASLNFTPSNWNTPQTVVVAGVDDGTAEGSVAYAIVTGAAVSSDADYSGLAVADVSVVNVASAASGGGLRGTYFDNDDFTGSRVRRLDSVINFDWANGSPHAAIGADTFTARWTGEIQPRYGETYTFYTTSDNGVRLWVDGVLLIDNWTDHAATVDSATITLAADQWYAIVMELRENTGVAIARLEWSSASQSRQIVPPTRLRPANAGPVAVDDAYAVVGETTLAVFGPGVLANDTDADFDVPAVSLVSGPSNGSLVLNGDGSFSYTPAPGFVGSDSFVYSIDDGWGGLDVATVNITVTPSPANPVASPDAYQIVSGNVLSVSAAGVLSNDTSPAGQPLTASLALQAAYGVVTLSPDGSFVYTPTAGFVGTDRFTYWVSDGNGSASAEVTVIVDAPPVPDPGPGPGPDPAPEPTPNPEPPIVVPPLGTPLPVPGDGEEVDEDAEPVPPSRNDAPPIVVTPGSTMQQNDEVGSTSPAAPQESSAKAVVRPSAPARGVSALPAPQVRIARRDASSEQSEEGSEAAEELGDEGRGRGPINRTSAVPSIGAFAGATPTAQVTTVGPLAAKLDAMARQIGAADSAHNATIRTVSQVAMAMTAGYVMWSLRGASLLASLLTSLPLWRSLDPLPILEDRADRDKAKAAAKQRKKDRRNKGRRGPDDRRDEDDKLGTLVN